LDTYCAYWEKTKNSDLQERMRMISQLAKNSKKDDNFGMRDEDWEVYKKISKVRIAYSNQ
jgi:actin-related protein 5